MRALALAVVFATLAACTPAPVVRPVQLPIPAPPDLPAISAEQVECLSDEAWAAIVERDLARKQYAERLRQVILDNNAGQE